MTDYAWETTGLFPAEANDVAAEIDKLIDRGNGKVTRDDILAAARNTHSALHSCIEWDDKKAADIYRRARVSSIIGGIKRADRKGRPTVQRAYVYVQPDDDATGGKAYVKLDVALRHSGLRRQMLQKAWRELASFRKRYAGYKELAHVIDLMRKDAEKGIESKSA